MSKNVAILNTETGEVKPITEGKFRNWTVVLYPDSMIPYWEDRIYRLIQLPFEYIIHDMDEVEIEEDESQKRKTHVHLIVHFPNTTTYTSVLSMFIDRLSAIGKRCCNKVEGVRNLRYMHLYLTHSTKDAIKDGKYRYKDSDIVSGNNWDTGAFVDLEESEKLNLYLAIHDAIVEHRFFTVIDLENWIRVCGGLDSKIDFMNRLQIIDFIQKNRQKYVQICKECYFKWGNKNDD